MIDNMLHTMAVAGLETAVNKALQLDPSTLNKLSTLQGHVFLLHCTAPELKLYLIPGEGEVRICGTYGDTADTTLRGSAQEFVKLVTSTDPANALINGDLELHGDSQALFTLQNIAKQLDIDWEAPLAELFGDVVSHQLGRGIRKGVRFGLKAIKGFKHHVDEYIVEESELVPSRWQVEKFFGEIDQLVLSTDRFQAKQDKFKKNLNNPS